MPWCASAPVSAVGCRSRCHGRACASGGRHGRGETIRRACEDPVKPIFPALQVRMGRVRVLRRPQGTIVSPVLRAWDNGGEECRSRFCFPAPARGLYALRLKHLKRLRTPSLLTAAVNLEACTERYFLGFLAIASRLRLKNRSRPGIAVNHAFAWPSPRRHASSASRTRTARQFHSLMQYVKLSN